MGKIGKYSLLFVTAAFLCAATLSVSAYSFQVAHSPMQAFAGTWKAVHEGKTIIVLRLHLDEAPLSGSIRLAGFQLDLEGNGTILTVTDERLDSPIALQDIKLRDRTLSFDFVDNDGDRDKFQMQISGANTATLQWVELPKNLQAQPITITRQSHSEKAK